MVDSLHLNIDVKSITGRQIRRLRKQAGLSQEELADQCGIIPTYLSRIEGGTANTSIVTLATLANALNVPVTELFQN